MSDKVVDLYFSIVESITRQVEAARRKEERVNRRKEQLVQDLTDHDLVDFIADEVRHLSFSFLLWGFSVQYFILFMPRSVAA